MPALAAVGCKPMLDGFFPVFRSNDHRLPAGR
jgi:hypothetical protein